MRFGGFLHAISHRGGERVEANACVLNVEHERVEIREHLRRGAARAAVEAVNGEAGFYVRVVGDGRIGAAGDTVFGTKESDEIYSGRGFQHVNRAASLGIDARLIGDQADAFAAQWREMFEFENV